MFASGSGPFFGLYDTPVTPLRDVNEVRQASTNYVRHEAPPFAADMDIS